MYRQRQLKTNSERNDTKKKLKIKQFFFACARRCINFTINKVNIKFDIITHNKPLCFAFIYASPRDIPIHLYTVIYSSTAGCSVGELICF